MNVSSALDGRILGREFGPYERQWSRRDSIIYALGVGAGTDELQYTTDSTAKRPQQVIPTFMINQGVGGRGFQQSWIGEPNLTVHAGHRLVLHASVAAEGSVQTEGRITEVSPKRSGRLVTVEWQSHNTTAGQLVCENTISYFVREPVPAGMSRPSRYVIGRPVPGAPPTEKITESTLATQALLYRCSGDPNVIHTDPEVAKAVGFKGPILHGLCTLGFAARAILSTVCDGDPGVFRSVECRFVSPGYPGDTLTTSIWHVPGGASFRTSNQDGTVLLDRGFVAIEVRTRRPR